MSQFQYQSATPTQRVKIEGLVTVLTELRIGIEAAHKAITAANEVDKKIACSDANQSHAYALRLVTETPIAMANPVVQEQFKHLQALLRRIH